MEADDNGLIDPVLSGIPLAGALYGGYKNAQAVKEQKRDLYDYESNLDSWYNNQVKGDFLDTNVASSAITQAKDQLHNANKTAASQAAITGGTNESVLAAKTANQKNFSNSLSKVASMGTAYEDRATSRYMAQKPMVLEQKMGMTDADVASGQNMSANSADLMGNVMSLAGFMI